MSTSFFLKPLGCYGDGGAIFTNDESLATTIKSIRIHGSGDDKYHNIKVGLNGRMDTLQAAILIEKLKIFDNEIVMRNKISKYYSKNITNKLTKPYLPKDYISSWAQYSLLASSSKERKNLMSKLGKSKVPSMIYYKIPLHLQKVFKFLNYRKGDFPVCEDLAQKIFSIPMHPYLSRENQDVIVEVLNYE